jgi:cytochrome oxidase Cu insertion factor (SCO1/SenC/PrrC family)
MKKLAVALVVLLVAGGAGPAAAADKALNDLMFDLQLVPLDGQVPPPFELERFSDGKKVSLAELRGRPLMLYFWATW